MVKETIKQISGVWHHFACILAVYEKTTCSVSLSALSMVRILKFSHCNGYVHCLLVILTCCQWLIKRLVISCAYLSCVSINFLVAVIKNVTRSNLTLLSATPEPSRCSPWVKNCEDSWAAGVGEQKCDEKQWGCRHTTNTNGLHRPCPGWPSTDSRSLPPLIQKEKVPIRLEGWFGG